MHNTYFEAKKQVGEHVEKSPEPKKYRLYKDILILKLHTLSYHNLLQSMYRTTLELSFI